MNYQRQDSLLGFLLVLPLLVLVVGVAILFRWVRPVSLHWVREEG
jgi:hypothetical protein